MPYMQNAMFGWYISQQVDKNRKIKALQFTVSVNKNAQG